MRTRRALPGVCRRPLLGLALVVVAGCGGGPEPPATAAAPGRDAFEDRLAAFLEEASPGAERVALLVGVGDYAASGLPSLSGSANDLTLMRRVLSDRLGFEARDLLVLRDAEATHEHIVRAFERAVLSRAHAGTEVFLYLAGHGSRVPDRSGVALAEPDRWDSTFVAYDSRQGGRHGERDLTDDELRSLVEALTRRTDRVTVVTDSCHSGELLRGAQARAVADASAALDLGWLGGFWPAEVTLAEDGPGRRLDPARYVHVAAAERDQAASEVTVEVDGQPRAHGALTWFLACALERAADGATWREVVDEVSARVRREAHQSVRCEGDLDRAVLGGARRAAFGQGAVLGDDGRIEVEAGWVLGLREGSALEVRDARGERLLGTATVTRVRPDRALARWDAGSPAEGDEEPGTALRVRETARGPGEPPLALAADDPLLRHLVADCPLVELVEEPGLARYRLRSAPDGVLRLETTDGIPIGAERPVVLDDGPDAVREALVAVFRRELVHVGLMDLAFARGACALGLHFRGATAPELARYPGFEPVEILGRRAGHSVLVEGAALDAEPGRLGMLEVTNDADRALWVYVLSIEESGARALMTKDDEYAIRLEPGASEGVPVSVVERGREAWPLERPMLDRYVVLAVEQRLGDPLALEARGQTRSAGRDRLPGVVERLVRGDPTRGGGPKTSLSPVGWGIAHVDLLVHAPDHR